jgi:hypothetical protein
MIFAPLPPYFSFCALYPPYVYERGYSDHSRLGLAEVRTHPEASESLVKSSVARALKSLLLVASRGPATVSPGEWRHWNDGLRVPAHYLRRGGRLERAGLRALQHDAGRRDPRGDGVGTELIRARFSRDPLRCFTKRWLDGFCELATIGLALRRQIRQT